MLGKMTAALRALVYSVLQMWAVYVVVRRLASLPRTTIVDLLGDAAATADERVNRQLAATLSREEVSGLVAMFATPPPAQRVPTRQTEAYVSWQAGREARRAIVHRR